MRILARLFSVCGLLALTLVGFTNFAPVDLKEYVPETLKKPEYVQIDGKLYKKNASGVYHIDGVPTFVKKGKPEEAQPVKKSRLGPPINPDIYKEAMGLQGDEKF